MKILDVLNPERFVRELPNEIIRRRYINLNPNDKRTFPNAYEFEINIPSNYDYEKDNTPDYGCQILMLNTLMKNELINQMEYENIKAYLKNKFKVA